ncbi:FHA domain-containing protein [Roseibium sp.]|uniref:FHA domain-containing protein n=1 Tax=Roseibium sp. TaxID=1936156 RepID=UPI003A98597A
MSDEQPTRMIKRTPDAEQERTKIFSGGTVSPTVTSQEPPVAVQKADAANSQGTAPEPVTRMISGTSKTPDQQDYIYELAAGWLVVVEGPGRGATREIFFGMNSLGRNPDQRIPLNFGDMEISRDSHAFIVYDEKQNDFYVQHGGKANLVRHNDRPVLSPVELTHGDMLSIGATKLMFMPLCSDTFNWTDVEA